MAKREILIFVTFAALVLANEADDVEQKKRGAGKANSLNAIPTGVQKSDYTYGIYSQNTQSNLPSSQYQPASNSFYPSHGPSQYYAPSNSHIDTSSTYSQQPHLNLIPPTSSSQFVPINIVPNSNYPSKHQIVPPKTSNGNLQLAIIQQPAFPHTFVSYSQPLFTPNPLNQINSHQNSLLNPLQAQGHFNIAPNYPSLSLGSSYISQPPAMVLVTQPSPSLHNNLLYQNPLQSFYNYYPSSSQSKYTIAYGSLPSYSAEYEKLQGPISQNIPKEDNDLSTHDSDYITPSEPNSIYKRTYSSGRNSAYTKLK